MKNAIPLKRATTICTKHSLDVLKTEAKTGGESTITAI